MSFADDYVEQMRKSVEAFRAAAFPDDVMEAFRISAEADITAGLNLCDLHKTPTMQRLYPDARWICDACANVMFKPEVK